MFWNGHKYPHGWEKWHFHCNRTMALNISIITSVQDFSSSMVSWHVDDFKWCFKECWDWKVALHPRQTLPISSTEQHTCLILVTLNASYLMYSNHLSLITNHLSLITNHLWYISFHCFHCFYLGLASLSLCHTFRSLHWSLDLTLSDFP